MKPLTFWDRLKRAVRDRSFIIGSALVILFLLIAILGPEVAPHNPYLRDRIQTIDGQIERAPFPPSDLYPLGTDDQGRDMLSMLLFGARQTLVIAFVAMTARLLLGLVLGTLSGWWSGSLFDRAITALTEFLAAVPGLILTILIVLAVGIRRGQISFIIALSLVGWGEVTQVVRSQVMTLRKKLFILASQAVGLGQAQILSRHVLPNLMATLLALAALEMGGVLLLLGELGFVHIFIGGGGLYVDEAVGTIHYFDVPDWGAMLGTSWRYFRTLPWLPLAPALAFFVTILGFNLFGYGLQRFIEKGRFHPSGWSLIRLFAVIALLLVGARALLVSTGIEAQFAKVARQFDVQRAWNDISLLTRPELEGRPTGPGGGFEAASYVAYQFEQIGLTPFTSGEYFQTFSTAQGRITTMPSLELLGDDGTPRMQFTDEIFFDPLHPFDSEGTAEAQLVVVANSPRAAIVETASDTLLLLLNPYDEPPRTWITEFPFAGALRLASDDQPSLSTPPDYVHTYRWRTYPDLFVRESAVRQILEEADLDLDELLEQSWTGERMIVRTGLRMRITAGLVYEETTGVNVVGYFPAADIRTQGERILVAAPYNGPLPQDGAIYPGADENASGVAVVLEIARLWHDLQFEPKRTVVFAAVDEDGENYFTTNPILPTASGDTWTVIMLEGLGAGSPELARMETEYGLGNTFDQSARRCGVETEELGEWPFFVISYPFWLGGGRPHPNFTGITVTRLGDELSGTPADTLNHLDPELMWESGCTLAHFLMILSNR
jgi:ABC-type dipeptide/oligopeptide/nickel transport system permease subunit